MRLILTGGGTGGHIYPALVVGELAQSHGATLTYFGSLRGQESRACKDREIAFEGFPSEPLYSLKTLRGLKALVKLQQSRIMARRSLKNASPDVVFSTGGYSAGPVVAAARDLGIPYVIHTSDSIPARSSAMFGKDAFAFTCTFRSTVEDNREWKVVRTGQPIRPELREAAKELGESENLVFIIGGSQGSVFLNETVPVAASKLSEGIQFLHACGPSHLEATVNRVEKLGLSNQYKVVGYLNTNEMVDAYRRARVVVARSGGTVAELALFGLPSVLIPLPSAANDHQLHNAREFEKMNAATVLNQSDASPANLAQSLRGWLTDDARRAVASRHLQEWDVPDAADQIVSYLERAMK